MSKYIDVITDDDVHIIGHATRPAAAPEKEMRRRNWSIPIISTLFVIALGILALVFWPREIPEDPYNGVFDNRPPGIGTDNPINKALGQVVDSTKSYTEKIDTVINDVALSIYIPRNATPELMVGSKVWGMQNWISEKGK